MTVRPASEVAPRALAPQGTLHNGVWNAGSNALIALAGLGCSVIVVRSLSPEAYGEFSYYLWAASVAGAVGTLALPHALTKVGAELLGQARAHEAGALTAQVWRATLLLNSALALLLAGVWLRDPGRPFLLVLAATQLPTALAGIASSHLWARQQYQPVALWTGLAALAQVVLVVLADVLGWGGPGFTAAVLASGAVTWLGLLRHLRGVPLRHPPALSPGVTARYAAFAVPATLSRLIEVVVWQRSELYFLSRLSSVAQVGFYSLAYTIYAIALAVGWALINGYYPALSHLQGAVQAGTQPQDAIRRKVQQGVNLAALYAAPICFAAVVSLRAVVELLYGEKMQPAVAVGQLLLLGLIPGVICGMLSLTVSALGRIWYGVALGLGIAALNIGLALWFIPSQGALGAAAATTAAQAVYALGLAQVTLRLCRVPLAWRPPLVLTALAAATILGMAEVLTHLWPAPGSLMAVMGAALGAVFYLALIWRGRLSSLIQPPQEPT